MDFSFLIRNPLPIIGESDLKRSAVAIALTENEEVVFEVRSEAIAHQPGDICLPGGGMEDGETPEEAVVRELAEELRINKDQVQAVVPFSIFVTGMQDGSLQGCLYWIVSCGFLLEVKSVKRLRRAHYCAGYRVRML